MWPSKQDDEGIEINDPCMIVKILSILRSFPFQHSRDGSGVTICRSDLPYTDRPQPTEQIETQLTTVFIAFSIVSQQWTTVCEKHFVGKA